MIEGKKAFLISLLSVLIALVLFASSVEIITSGNSTDQKVTKCTPDKEGK